MPLLSLRCYSGRDCRETCRACTRCFAHPRREILITEPRRMRHRFNRFGPQGRSVFPVPAYSREEYVLVGVHDQLQAVSEAAESFSVNGRFAALTAAGALAFVLVPTWARDRYAAPSAEPAKVFGLRRAEKTLPALPVTTPHYFHHVYRPILMAPLPRSTFDECHFPAQLREFEIDRTPDGYLPSSWPTMRSSNMGRSGPDAG